MTNLLEAFITWLLDSRAFSPATARNYRATILDFQKREKVEDFTAVTVRQLDRYIGTLSLEGFAESTRRNRAHALKSFFRFLHSRGYMPENPALELRAPRRRATEAVPVLTPEEISAMTFAFRPALPVRGRGETEQFFARRLEIQRLKQQRDTVLLAVSYTLALRVSEPGTFEARDYQLVGSVPVLTLREGKDMPEPFRFRLDRRVQRLLDEYLVELSRAGVNSSALFPPLRDTDRTAGLGKRQVDEIFKSRIAAAGIDARGRRLSFHMFRYSCATHLHQAGLKVEEIQTHLRHRSIETTMRYIRLGSLVSIQKAAIAALPWNRARTFGRSKRADSNEPALDSSVIPS